MQGTNKTQLVLGIETSCDDTSICLLSGLPGKDAPSPEVLAHLSFSQEKILKKWGGVVPEIASRNHLAKLTPLIQEAFEVAKKDPKDIDLLGVTTHPGLLGPLLTGLSAAKSISLIFEKPILPVNHVYAHLEAIHLSKNVNITYPYFGLIVSGGHSLYLLVRSPEDFEILGNTRDDAAGEAFDKGGKLIGLGYPAGRVIDDLAKEGNCEAFDFPIGLKHSKDSSLSFSGVKTAMRQFLENNPEHILKDKTIPEEGTPERKNLADLCASYQEAIVKALALKAKFAMEKALSLSGEKSLQLVVGGGVACNSRLRTSLKEKFIETYFVEPKFCTDNGAMIANFALRNFESAVAFPECLSLDAKSSFIKKTRIVRKKS
ncbi:tRNA (adenosine(37)-N6)-threonylcarbamoyltransferase complex transferase subunit TsaD [Bacteriovoracales bacterium]|nr:tRNA (adenosine(37)-N6)-threonylcarbamoyltransferase complex transferase subunit TsaD [Bacteriovoracales bacterium]